MPDLLLLELNELNFEYVTRYCQRGELPTFKRLFDRYPVRQTTSEAEYAHLEPWVQWVTAHTGKTLQEHGVFRLGDIELLRDVTQIWERLEREKGIRVGAISPMNAKNAIVNGGFFVPDPWTNTAVTGPYLLRRMSDAVRSAVNDNANGGMSIGSGFWLVLGAAANALTKNYLRYVSLLQNAIRRPWFKALFLDLLLADTFVTQTRRTNPRFASLFLNGAAHIQHHYMFSSSVYEGHRRNPEWYVERSEDPVLDVYRLYDHVLETVLSAFPESRVMIATALHQDPHDYVTYYWRLKDHADFLRRIGVSFVEVRTRMSRDFLVVFQDESAARAAEQRLAEARAPDGSVLFEVDNRGIDLFVMLTYDKEIDEGFNVQATGTVIENFRDHVVFVALKNGKHNGTGYFLDTGPASGHSPASFELRDLPDMICDAIR